LRPADLRKLLVGALDLPGEVLFEGDQFAHQSLVSGSQNLNGQNRGVTCPVQRHGRHGNTRGHLQNRQDAVPAVDRVGRLDRHADYGNRRMGGYHTGQVGRSAGSGDNRSDTSPVSVLGEIGDHFGHPVRRQGVDLVGNLHFVEKSGGSLHDFHVGSAAHDDTDFRCHCVMAFDYFAIRITFAQR